jgi:hypothetical protein
MVAARSSSLRGQSRPWIAAHALERRGGDDALGRAADAEQDVDAGVGPRGGDRTGDVAVTDEADAGAGLADLGDELVVAGPVEDHAVTSVTSCPWPWPRRAGSRWGWR